MRRGTTKRHTASNKNAHHHCEEAPQAHMPRDSSSAHKAARLNAGTRRICPLAYCRWKTPDMQQQACLGKTLGGPNEARGFGTNHTWTCRGHCPIETHIST
ncbi:hypothetical protein HYQ46_002333 [Verticillium longisporum]|nr:hypothetical protein HYQ46_002333 [Verticillium longisporum]